MRTIRDCSVAVVGGAGFLGSHAVNHLIEDRGCKVLVVDDFSAGRHEFVHPAAAVETQSIMSDSPGYLASIFRQYEIEYVLNYAAIPYIPDGYAKAARRVHEVNFRGALNVLDAAVQAKCKGILQLSTSEVYGGVDGPISEDQPLAPRSSYAVSKAAIDMACRVKYRETGVPVVVLRQFNCVGERETHPYIVPEIISQLHGDFKDVVCLKLGNNTARDFMYAGDAARLAVELLERGEFGEAYNLGSGRAVSMYNLAQMLSDIIGCGRLTFEHDQSRLRKWEVWHLQADNSKIMKTYPVDGGLPKLTTLEEALRRTVAYYRGNGRKWCWEK